MSKSLMSNVVYSSLLSSANYIFPLITFPYISRVLGVENIGICNFVDSIINYCLLLSTMGIGTIGVREVARCKDNKEELSIVFTSLFALNGIFTIIVLIGLVLIIILSTHLHAYSDFLIVGAFKVIFSFLLIEWLYKGLEEFRYITVRTLLIRLLYVVMVFVLVHERSDLYIYYWLTTITIIINAIYNCAYSGRYIKLKKHFGKFKAYIKPCLTLGLYTLLTSMYTTFNVFYLGLVAGDINEGYYTTATKLHGIILSLFSAFTIVMLPRMSSLFVQNKLNEFKSLYDKSLSILLGFSIPATVLCILFADVIVQLVAGPGFESSIPCLQIVAPLLVIIGYEQILVIQVLMPLKKDKNILINSILGASIGIALNLLLVSRFQAIGSSIVWVLSELIVLLSAQYFVTKAIGIKLPLGRFFKVLLQYVPCILILLGLKYLPIDQYLIFGLACSIIAVYVFIIQTFIEKNPLVLSILNRFN